MKLKTVTGITIAGVAISTVVSLLAYQWNHILGSPRMIVSLSSMICFRGSLLFFLIQLQRKS